MPRNRNKSSIRHAAPVFAALGDDLRLQIVARLSAGEPLSIARLSHGTAVTRQAVTKHLHVLESAGLLRGCRRGREQLWELRREPLETVSRYLESISREWDDALGRLKALVEDAEE